LPPVAFSFYRGLADLPFADADRAKLRLVLPHLSRSLGVMMRLQDADFKVAASLAALDRIRAGVLLLDSEGLVIFANNAVNRIVADADGIKLSAKPGTASRLELVADFLPATQRLLAQAIRGAIAPEILATTHFSRSVPIPRRSGRAPYMVQFSNLPAQSTGGFHRSARAIAFLTDPAEPMQADTGFLKTSFGLTPAEIRVAQLLAEGNSAERVAVILDVSVNTVRTQIKQLYAKTGVDSRARFVKLMLGLSSN
jgi:DNA-binding CsgD family transcriptional regulator